MFYRIWFRRLLLSPRDIFQLTSLFSVVSLILGVAVLTTALLAVNGFSLSLQKVIVDRNGHLVFLTERERPVEKVLEKIQPYGSDVTNRVPFLSFEGLILTSREMKGVIFEGMDFKSLSADLKSRILKGKMDFEKPVVILGSALAKDLKVSVGSSLQGVVLESVRGRSFSRKKKSFVVGSVTDFGKHDLNSRYVLMSLDTAQKFTGGGRKISGARLWLKDGKKAESISRILNYQHAHRGYRAVSWMDMEKSFFHIIRSDKKIIFLVLLILIIAGGFNVSSALFVQVLKKTGEIGILKAVGAGDGFILRIFLLRGLLLGCVGGILGLFTGSAVFRALMFFQKKWNFFPGEIYQISEVAFQWKTWDLALVFIVTLIVVLLAGVLPARRACRVSIKDSLNYE